MKEPIFAFINAIFFLFPGPAFWGLINPEWSLCNKGRRQSPVNLEPAKLLFDPNLRSLHIDKHRVSIKLKLNYLILHLSSPSLNSPPRAMRILRRLRNPPLSNPRDLAVLPKSTPLTPIMMFLLLKAECHTLDHAGPNKSLNYFS